MRYVHFCRNIASIGKNIMQNPMSLPLILKTINYNTYNVTPIIYHIMEIKSRKSSVIFVKTDIYCFTFSFFPIIP